MRAITLVLVVVSAVSCAGTSVPRAVPDPGTSPAAQPLTAVQLPPGVNPRDAAAIRKRILLEMDRRIDERAAQEHLDLRLMLDRTLPVPYLGVDADPVTEPAAGMKVTKVYDLTGAAEAGLREGDVILAVSGEATPDGAHLGGAIRSRSLGDALSVRVLRDGAELLLEGTLGPRPEEDEDESEQFPYLADPEAPAPAPVALSFDDDAAGAAPRGLAYELSGHGAPGDWVVVEGDATSSGRFVRQRADDVTGIRFPMALLAAFRARDVEVSVRFRLTGGRQDRAAGVIVRMQDPSNYIVVRANSIESDLRIFRTVRGLRRTLPEGRIKIDVGDDRWHTLVVRAEGPRITATLDGTQTVSSYDTYLTGGGVGLWTKSDSVTDFDDLAAEAIAPQR